MYGLHLETCAEHAVTNRVHQHLWWVIVWFAALELLRLKLPE